jgi:Trp operon repressor
MTQKRKNLDEIKQHLESILNENEIKHLELKVKILKCLELAMTQRAIAKKLKCSVNLVNKINKLILY